MAWLLTRGRWAFLGALGVLTAWFAWQASRVGVENNNESLVTQDPAAQQAYARFKATFGSDEDLLLAVVQPNLLGIGGLTLIDAVTRRVAAIDGVRHVFSLTNAKQLVPGSEGAEEAPLVPPPYEAADIETKARLALDQNPDFVGMLVSADRRTAGIVVEIEDRAADTQYRASIIEALRALMNELSHDGAEFHLTGVAVQKHDVTTFIERDQLLLMPLGLLTLAILLAAFFRRLLGIALPLAVTGISVAGTLGTYHLAGLEVNAITALLPPVIMVLSIAVSVHLIQAWLQAPANQTDRCQRIRHVVDELAFPCFFCSLSTALGFGSLIFSDMPAVRQFGFFAAFGVLLAFAVGITLVPVGLTFLKPPTSPLDSAQHRLMRRMLDWTAMVAAHHPVPVLSVFVFLTVLSVFGLPMIRNNTDLVRFLKTSAPLYRDTMFIDSHLTGANALEFMVERNDGAPLNGLDDVQRLAQFEDAVRRKDQVTAVTSVVAILRQLQRAESGSGRLALPDNERDTAYLFDLLDAAKDRALVDKVISRDLKLARVSVRTHVVGTAIAAPLADDILDSGRRVFGPSYTLTPTGAFYYVARDSNRLVDSQLNSFSAGLITVFVAIALLFRALKPTIVSIIPNVIPLVWTGGLMGVLGIDLSTGTAMIASAVIGMVVDDTIHYLDQFYRTFDGDAVAAVHSTTTGVGAALFMNNMVLVLGFWVGAFGSFKPTIYFSLLTGLTMITAMICDLFVTPACLVLLERRRPT
ncbi:MAG: MMPL family transporter [Deltaproteobacteria bacterium]|nr:MMPL family transporter [Deltaproteobacteria bacterium]